MCPNTICFSFNCAIQLEPNPNYLVSGIFHAEPEIGRAVAASGACSYFLGFRQFRKLIAMGVVMLALQMVLLTQLIINIFDRAYHRAHLFFTRTHVRIVWSEVSLYLEPREKFLSRKYEEWTNCF